MVLKTSFKISIFYPTVQKLGVGLHDIVKKRKKTYIAIFCFCYMEIISPDDFSSICKE